MEATKPSRPKTNVPHPANAWWPVLLGTPTTSGTADNLRYAYFPLQNRLAIERQGTVTVYDTGKYQFRGVLQSVGNEGRMSFASQHGRVNVDDLAQVT